MMKWLRRLFLRWDRYWLDRQRSKTIQLRLQKREKRIEELINKLEPKVILPRKKSFDSENYEWTSMSMTVSLTEDDTLPEELGGDWDEALNQLPRRNKDEHDSEV